MGGRTLQKRDDKTLRPTLAEVARLAGVSPATVSRALNHADLVAEDTAARIREAVRKSGYVPNLIAGGLASNRSRLIAVIVPALAGSVFNETIEVMTEELMRARYQVMLALSGYKEEHLESVIESVLARRPEGVILTGTVNDPGLRERLLSIGATIIETRHLPKQPLDHVVGFSQEAIGAAVAELFHDMGRRAPLVIGAETARASERLQGFKQAMARHGVKRVTALSYPVPAIFAHGRDALAQALDSGLKPDCVMCSSDWQAHGVMVEAQRRGLSIPGDLAVVGFGNMDFAENIVPSLTSVHIDGRRIGAEAVRILLAHGELQAPALIDVGFSLIRRESA